jgi:NAD(P)-dependent dehydrogenase (short-subunit alcohol dehydrogenase family)
LAVNLKGAYLFSKYAIPEMRRGGAIINISSAHAYVSWARCPAYDASKTGLLGLTRAMAIDHGPQGIRVNAICPGYIETPMLEKAFAAGEADRAAVLKFHPLGRIGRPADVADTALFLASEGASFISGAVLAVDGCLTAQGL